MVADANVEGKDLNLVSIWSYTHKMHRCPVRYQGKPLMPMKSTRVKKFIDSGKGRIRYDRKLKIHYLQLLVDPSGEDTQEVHLGLDPGSNIVTGKQIGRAHV